MRASARSIAQGVRPPLTAIAKRPRSFVAIRASVAMMAAASSATASALSRTSTFIAIPRFALGCLHPSSGLACLCRGRLEDALNGGVQDSVELRIRLLGRKAFDQGAREARHHSVIPAEAVVSFLARITSR